jgi:hypothetical protein
MSTIERVLILSDEKPLISTCYVHVDTRTIADLSLLKNGWMLITRINVPMPSRGKGFGRLVLNEVLRDADRFGVTLCLEPMPSGGLTFKPLADWYERAGFRWIDKGMMLRLPRTDRTLGDLTNVSEKVIRTRNDV